MTTMTGLGKRMAEIAALSTEQLRSLAVELGVPNVREARHTELHTAVCTATALAYDDNGERLPDYVPSVSPAPLVAGDRVAVWFRHTPTRYCLVDYGVIDSVTVTCYRVRFEGDVPPCALYLFRRSDRAERGHDRLAAGTWCISHR